MTPALRELTYADLVLRRTELFLRQRREGCTCEVANEIAAVNIALRRRERLCPWEVVCDE
jgi:hypothetical protein